MKLVFKLLMATLCLTQPPCAFAQSIYAIDMHSPIIIRYDADLNLAGKETTPAPKKLVVTALVDESGTLTEQDVYSRRLDFMPHHRLPIERKAEA